MLGVRSAPLWGYRITKACKTPNLTAVNISQPFLIEHMFYLLNKQCHLHAFLGASRTPSLSGGFSSLIPEAV